MEQDKNPTAANPLLSARAPTRERVEPLWRRISRQLLLKISTFGDWNIVSSDDMCLDTFSEAAVKIDPRDIGSFRHGRLAIPGVVVIMV